MALKTTKKRIFEVFAILKGGNSDQVGLIEQIFVSHGICIQDVAILNRNGSYRISAYASHQGQAKKILSGLRALRIKKVSFRLRTIPKQNWQKKWEKSFSPFALTKQFDVVPTWRKYQKTKRQPIFLSSINAFGTGLHETTHFMAQLIERCQHRFETFFDNPVLFFQRKKYRWCWN